MKPSKQFLVTLTMYLTILAIFTAIYYQAGLKPAVFVGGIAIVLTMFWTPGGKA